MKKNDLESLSPKNFESENIGTFIKQHRCEATPQVLQKLNIQQPIIIDLSQKKYKGIALYYGRNLKKVLHPEQWEQYEHFSTYTSDEKGNLYLVPMPFISIKPTTFNLQKNFYKLDTNTGKISIFMHFEDVVPSANNPYGINAIAYDCDDKTLWVASIDESDYNDQKGVIYHIDPKTKAILDQLEDFDALAMTIVKSKYGKYLVVGSARDNALYAYPMNNKGRKPLKLLELPDANEHIRKIKVIGRNKLELQAIPFSYTLITQTAKKDRHVYIATWKDNKKTWTIVNK